MKQKELSILLRAIVAMCGLVWLFFAYGFGKTLVLCFVEQDRLLTPVALICLMLVLVLAAMIDAWCIFTRIGQNNSFCVANAKALRRISFYALIATVLDVILIVYTLFTNAPHANGAGVWVRIPGMFDSQILLFVFVAMLGVAATVATATLSHLTLKAANLQDENDLTI